MWTLANVKTDLDNFLGPKTIPTLWMWNSWCKSIQERWQERVPTGPKSYSGRARFQPVYAIEESAGQCSRKLCSRRKIDPSADTYNVQRHGWTTQTGSQGSWRSGPSKQRFVWLCCGTMWTSLRVLMLKSDYLQGRRRTRSFNKLSMWIINLRNRSIY